MGLWELMMHMRHWLVKGKVNFTKCHRYVIILPKVITMSFVFALFISFPLVKPLVPNALSEGIVFVHYSVKAHFYAYRKILPDNLLAALTRGATTHPPNCTLVAV